MREITTGQKQSLSLTKPKDGTSGFGRGENTSLGTSSFFEKHRESRPGFANKKFWNITCGSLHQNLFCNSMFSLLQGVFFNWPSPFSVLKRTSSQKLGRCASRVRLVWKSLGWVTFGSKSLDPKYLHTSSTLSENKLSENTLSENTLSEDTLLEDTLSEDTLSKNTLSKNTLSENILSENTLLENTLSENTLSENTLSKNTLSKNAL